MDKMILTVLAWVGPFVSQCPREIFWIQTHRPALPHANRLTVRGFQPMTPANALEGSVLPFMCRVGKHVAKAQSVKRDTTINFWESDRSVRVPTDPASWFRGAKDMVVIGCKLPCPFVLSEVKDGPETVVAELQGGSKGQHFPEDRIELDEIGLREGAVLVAQSSSAGAIHWWLKRAA